MKESSSGVALSLKARLFNRSKKLLTEKMIHQILFVGLVGIMFGSLVGWTEETVRAQIEVAPQGVSPTELKQQLQLKIQEAASLKRNPTADQRLNELGVKAVQQGEVPVIIRLRVAYQPEGNLRRTVDIQAQRALIERARKSLLLDIKGYDAESVKEFKYLPYLAISLTPSGIEALRTSIQMIDIEEDILLAPALSNSVPSIGVNKAWETGYTGAGQTIAVVDSGIDKSHPYLAGKVVSEGCFSTNNRTTGSSSLCPGLASSTTAVNSGVHCNLPIEECKHGTLVGGVIAGNSQTATGVGEPLAGGIAKDATLISLNVYSRFENAQLCGSTAPCVLSYLTDQVRALERVYDIRNQYRIAAVNFGLSGQRYTELCDNASSILSDSIQQLAVLGIPTISPTGNNGYSDATGMPACMKSSISVGATELDPSGVERVYSKSNSAPFIHLLAPGVGITSAVPGGGYETWAGTSMATPHVSASWALLKQRVGSASIENALRALISTGVQVVDSRNTLSKPRIQIDEALQALSNNVPEIQSYTMDINFPIDRDPFKMTINGRRFDTDATRLYLCMVGTSSCIEHPKTKVKVSGTSIIEAESVALASGVWNLYLETGAGASGRSKPFTVMAPPPPPLIDSYSWTPANPRANQTFNGTINGRGFSVDGTKVYFCIAESSICSLLPNSSVAINSETRLTISGVTLNAGTWQVYVQTSSGPSPRSTSFKVEVAILPPAITSFAWNPAIPAENQPFGGVLTGANFIDKETKVYFCITTQTTCSVLPDKDVTVNSPSSMTVSNVSLRAGLWQIYVQTPGGSSPRSNTFTIEAQQLQPTIANYIWNPARPIENQPFSGSISGNNFVEGGTQVYFCEAGTVRCAPVTSASIKFETLISLTVSNIILKSGSWECYVSTPAGVSPRSAPFEVTTATLLPVINTVTFSSSNRSAFQPFVAVISGVNFVPGNTRAFLCPENSQNCQQQTTGVNATSSTSVSISNIILASGNWQLYLQTSAGNSNRSTPFSVDGALLPPTITGFTLTPSNPRTNEPFAATLTGTGFVVGNTEVSICVSGTANCAAVAEGNYVVTSGISLTMTNIRLESGSWQFLVQTPGGISGRSLPFIVQTPIAVPTISSQIWNPQVLIANQAASVTISGAGFTAAGTQVFLCVAGTETCFLHPTNLTVVNSPTSLTLNGIFLLAGTWEMYVQTSLGKSERTAAFTVRGGNQLEPTITGYLWSPVNPVTGFAFSGTINGTNFVTNATQVFFCVNGTSSCFQQPLENVRVINSTTITLINTFLMTGTWSFYVQTSAGVSARSTQFSVTRGDQVLPTLSSFTTTPSVLIEAQLFNAVITGNNFVPGSTQVRFCGATQTSCNELLASSINVMSQTQIELANISLPAGSWQVVINTPAGASNRSNSFTVRPQLSPPSIIGYSWTPAPTSNQPFSGSISGSNFDVNGTELFFCLASTCNKISSANIRVISANSINVTNLSLGTGNWHFYVVTAGGKSANSSVFSVTALSLFLPTISSISWQSSNLLGNQAFSGVITGTNFVTGGTQVDFCSNETGLCSRLNVSNVRVTNPTSLNVSNVELAAGSWYVQTETTLGRSNKSSSFTVAPPAISLPTIVRFTWENVTNDNPSLRGTITGTNFATEGTSVFFCNAASEKCSQIQQSQIEVVSTTSIKIQNVFLTNGSWQFYIQTAAGVSSLSTSFNFFNVTGEPIKPTLNSVSWTPAVPLSSSPISGSISATNLVVGLTKVFACSFPSNNCSQIPATSVTNASGSLLTLTNVRLGKGIWYLYLETPNGNTNSSRTFIVQ